jgi:hypothetical protein
MLFPRISKAGNCRPWWQHSVPCNQHKTGISATHPQTFRNQNYRADQGELLGLITNFFNMSWIWLSTSCHSKRYSTSIRRSPNWQCLSCLYHVLHHISALEIISLLVKEDVHMSTQCGFHKPPFSWCQMRWSHCHLSFKLQCNLLILFR